MSHWRTNENRVRPSRDQGRANGRAPNMTQLYGPSVRLAWLASAFASASACAQEEALCSSSGKLV